MTHFVTQEKLAIKDRRIGRCKPCKRAFLWHKRQASSAWKMPCPGCKQPLSSTTLLTKLPFEVIS